MNKIRVGIPYYDETKLGMITSSDMMTVANLISEPLLRLYDGKIWPALARSWQVFEDGRRWLFYISPNTFFHDNSPCTMADVFAAIEHVKSIPDEYGKPNIFNTYFKDIEFSILNRYALQARCLKPCGDLAEMLSMIQILKKNRLEKWVVGTGNYKYSGRWTKKSIRLTKLREMKLLSEYDQIAFFIIPDVNERIEALYRGEIDIASDLGSVSPSVKDNNIWWSFPSNRSVMGILNEFKPPFNNSYARKAVNLAVDVDRIINDLLNGYGIPAASIVSPYHCGYNSLLDPIPYDPALARKLFSQADIDHELVITACKDYLFPAYEIADMIAEQLTKVGLRVRVDKYDDRDTYKRLLSEKSLGDIILTQTGNKSTAHLLQEAVSSKEKGQLWYGTDDNTLLYLLNSASSEPDITERERKYSKVIIYLNRNPHWLYLYHPKTIYARNPKVIDVQVLHSGELRFPGAW